MIEPKPANGTPTLNQVKVRHMSAKNEIPKSNTPKIEMNLKGL
jgi:hypothetical protein